MNKHVVGSVTMVVALVVCLGVAGAAIGTGNPQTNCQTLMNQVGEQAKAVKRAQNNVNVAQQSLDSCLADQQQARQQGKKVDCRPKQDELKKQRTILKAEQDKLAAIQKEYSTRCGK